MRGIVARRRRVWNPGHPEGCPVYPRPVPRRRRPRERTEGENRSQGGREGCERKPPLAALGGMAAVQPRAAVGTPAGRQPHGLRHRAV